MFEVSPFESNLQYVSPGSDNQQLLTSSNPEATKENNCFEGSRPAGVFSSRDNKEANTGPEAWKTHSLKSPGLFFKGKTYAAQWCHSRHRVGPPASLGPVCTQVTSASEWRPLRSSVPLLLGCRPLHDP